jgi:phage protein U
MKCERRGVVLPIDAGGDERVQILRKMSARDADWQRIETEAKGFELRAGN